MAYTQEGRRKRAREQWNANRRKDRASRLAITTECVRWLDGWAIVKGNTFTTNVIAQFPTRDEAVAEFRRMLSE